MSTKGQTFIHGMDIKRKKVTESLVLSITMFGGVNIYSDMKFRVAKMYTFNPLGFATELMKKQCKLFTLCPGFSWCIYNDPCCLLWVYERQLVISITMKSTVNKIDIWFILASVRLTLWRMISFQFYTLLHLYSYSCFSLCWCRI